MPEFIYRNGLRRYIHFASKMEIKILNQILFQMLFAKRNNKVALDKV